MRGHSAVLACATAIKQTKEMDSAETRCRFCLYAELVPFILPLTIRTPEIKV